MSLKSKINGKTKTDKEFKEILLSVEPNKEDYYTLSGKKAFSDDYNLYVPNNLLSTYDSALVGTAFDYLARFRIAQFLKREDTVKGLVALKGFKKIPDYNSKSEIYLSWMDKVLEYIKHRSMPITSLLEVAVKLAKLEQIARARMRKEDINVDYLLFEPSPKEVLTDLENLMAVFNDTFIIPEIINMKSEVVFNPNFGVGSALVSGADADIFIDGTLYDFKATKDNSLKKNDNLQMIGYFLLNELAITTNSDLLEFDYAYIDIKRLAFYKTRFGEIEYYDVNKYLPLEGVKQILKEMAEYFKDNQGSLNLMWMSDIDSAKEILEEIRKS